MNFFINLSIFRTNLLAANIIIIWDRKIILGLFSGLS